MIIRRDLIEVRLTVVDCERGGPPVAPPTSSCHSRRVPLNFGWWSLQAYLSCSRIVRRCRDVAAQSYGLAGFCTAEQFVGRHGVLISGTFGYRGRDACSTSK